MKRCLLALVTLVASSAAFAAPAQPPAVQTPAVQRPAVQRPAWSTAEIAALRQWVAAAPRDALPALATTDLDRATGTSPAAVDDAATALALRLARLHLLGCASSTSRAGWHIADTDSKIDVSRLLAQALASDAAGSAAALDRFFAGLRPHHPEYAALRAAYATETDPARRHVLALNMERWRWMPLALGPNYILVNAAKFEVTLWRDGQLAGTWPVIVGKPRSPTPIFSATVTGVTFNPWWDVPANIVRESIGSLVRRHPALARQRGYVWGAGRYRQRPGPANALGQMKLVMPNPYNVYLHDTPDKPLFAKDIRAFSHGCIRVGDALGFAATLLRGTDSSDKPNAAVAGDQTSTLLLAAPLPVYVTYFTAVRTSDGTVQLLPDIYGRDANKGHTDGHACAA